MRIRYYFSFLVYVILVGLLVSCDPVPLSYLSVDRIAVIDEIPYIHVLERQSLGPGCCFSDEEHYFISQDNGKTWQELSSSPAIVLSALEASGEIQLTACVPNNESICYRIAGKEQVEVSNNGGKTWKSDWEMPPGRKRYIERNPDIISFVGVTPDTVPFDLGIVSNDNQHVVIIAMGNQGVLVKASSGLWERYAIPSTNQTFMLATPLPFYAVSIEDAVKILKTESVWSFLVTFLIFVVLSFLAWRSMQKNATREIGEKLRWFYLPFVLASMGFIVFVVALFGNLFFHPFQDSRIGEFLYGFLANPSLYVCFIPIIGLLLSWFGIIRIYPDRKIGQLIAFGTLAYTTIFGIAVYMPFIFWAFGIIPLYEMALSLSIILGIASAVLGVRQSKSLWS